MHCNTVGYEKSSCRESSEKQVPSPTVAVGATNRGSWRHQVWQLMAPIPTVAFGMVGE